MSIGSEEIIFKGMVIVFDSHMLAKSQNMKKKPSSQYVDDRNYVCIDVSGDYSTWAEVTRKPGNNDQRLHIKKVWRKGEKGWNPSLDLDWSTEHRMKVGESQYINSPDSLYVGPSADFKEASYPNNRPKGQRRLVTEDGVKAIRQFVGLD